MHWCSYRNAIMINATILLTCIASVLYAHCGVTLAESSRRKANQPPYNASELTGSIVLAPNGAPFNWHNVYAIGYNLYDYSFTSAPTDWWIHSGQWRIMNRWTCAPGWSWYGGQSRTLAAIWNKRKFIGDIMLEFYFALKMDVADAGRWHYRLGDVGATICGDGKNISSGYSFVMGAFSNRRTVLFKGERIVAETTDPESLFPVASDGPVPANKLHRKWWGVRMHKVGNNIRVYIDDHLVLNYVDPKPLNGGQVALWCIRNGILIARVRIYYEHEVLPASSTTSIHPQIAKGLSPAPAILSSSQALQEHKRQGGS